MRQRTTPHIKRVYGNPPEVWDHFDLWPFNNDNTESRTKTANLKRAKHEETAALARIEQERILTAVATAKANEAAAKAAKAVNEARAAEAQLKAANGNTILTYVGIVLGVSALIVLGVVGYRVLNPGKRKGSIKTIRGKALKTNPVPA